MLKQVKKSRASRAIVAAALVSLGSIAVSTSPVIAAEDGARDPNGLYILGVNPWFIVKLPFKILSLAVSAPLSLWQGQRDGYEG